jgi:hypothetical protein
MIAGRGEIQFSSVRLALLTCRWDTSRNIDRDCAFCAAEDTFETGVAARVGCC